MSATPERIKLLPHARETEIITTDGRSLGKMVPGLGYWVTPENRLTVDRLLASKEAVMDDPKKAPMNGIQLDMQDALVSGAIST